MNASAVFPGGDAVLVGRVFDPLSGGPRVVGVHRGVVSDLTDRFPTVSQLLERDDAVDLVTSAPARADWTLEALLRASSTDAADESDAPAAPDAPRLLAPIDLQVIKACGVTFAKSLVERLIEEHTRGDSSRSHEVRTTLLEAIGADALTVRPGSAEAEQVKSVLVERGMWSQYLEVGIGPDPEVFTKGPVLSAVGYGQAVGVPSFSDWSNPEPELVLVVDSAGVPRGATLGNDVNLRDVEGRSALLLGVAKDNNGSTAVGPFIRLFDGNFSVDSLRDEVIHLEIEGEDAFTLDATSNMAEISRDFEELVSATHGAHHQYPDGFALFTGTLFTPTEDRDTPGRGFTHRLGDRVTISSPQLGTLLNVVGRSEDIPRWEFGIAALFDYLRRAVPSSGE
ncbi:fumarylacetoacetate hydrolase [Herbiconiux sp. CPCC 205763]|uniref:Fumarylacetoacetate hydrolase n=1 Tax=Herbiconiux aconitum TaxID=2970913 RepID=A0ABT2GSK1_9MICO|nr:fumarylacetoacetate hydrolase family protein [Herbiconiux aconitum]MCS5717796.1 fumarylacetoacetate hydrolase [Herbiconiux aconitum]